MNHVVWLMRRAEVEQVTGLGRSAIYERTNPESPRYDPDFPTPVRLGNTASVGWVSSEVFGWVNMQIATRDAGRIAKRDAGRIAKRDAGRIAKRGPV